jgi:hypothetical protein
MTPEGHMTTNDRPSRNNKLTISQSQVRFTFRTPWRFRGTPLRIASNQLEWSDIPIAKRIGKPVTSIKMHNQQYMTAAG